MKRPYCPHCGSKLVEADATIWWSDSTGGWVTNVGPDHDDFYCTDCGEESFAPDMLTEVERATKTYPEDPL